MKSNSDIAVIIPSYNEVENLSILIKSINKELFGSKIIIVDDSSSLENTKLRKIVKRRKNVTLISRFKKVGRGSAVIDGFRMALRDKNIRYFFEMDSDLAHDPKEFERFLDRTKEDSYDLIIGSRYLPGGKIIHIAPNRTIMSRLINKFLYYWLGIHLTDYTSGFRLYSRRAVEFLVKTKLESRGFITLSETAYRLHKAGFKISEVPITWNFRIYGKSNVNLNELINSFTFVIEMRAKDLLNYFKLG